MFYRGFVRFLSLVAGTFYRRIEVVGLENVPPSGAVIFAGNHPNALIDGLLLASLADRSPIHFLGNAKLWGFPLLSGLLEALGAIPVLRREEHGGDADNRGAFARVDDILVGGGCVAIFPEGISHADSRLATLKTGTARMALHAAAHRDNDVAIVPFGLTYLYRDRFRSQVLLQFAAPIPMDDARIAAYQRDEVGTVRQLTAELGERITAVTLSAPDWATLRFIHAARRLYKPTSAKLTPASYVDLSRRFVERYALFAEKPDVQRLRVEVEAYQAELDGLGLKDHQLSHPVSASNAIRRIVWRTVLVVVLFPLALPGGIVLLPVAWLAATVGSRFSYDSDDIATLKVVTAVPVLLSTYALVAIPGWSRTRVGLGCRGTADYPGQFLRHAVCLGETGPTAHLDAQPASPGTLKRRHRRLGGEERRAGGCRADCCGSLRRPHHPADVRRRGLQQLGGGPVATRVNQGFVNAARRRDGGHVSPQGG